MSLADPPIQEQIAAKISTAGERIQRDRPKPKSQRLSTIVGRKTVTWMRKIHLYSGIFMFPFVLLYGFSGWFFNHPGYFQPGNEISTHLSAATNGSGEPLSLMPASELAAQVVDELNIESFSIGGPEIVLTEEKTPRFSNFYNYTVQGEDETHTVRVNPASGAVSIKTEVFQEEPIDESEPPVINPMVDVRGADLLENPQSRIEEAIPSLLEQNGLSTGEIFPGRRSAGLIFSVEADGVPCLVDYNFGSGAVSSIAQAQRQPMDTKSLMRRMHLARMYTPQFDVRWFWALVVDLMFASMVFWGISGLAMWFQNRRTRTTGGAVLLASIIFSSFMVIGMHDNLTEGIGGRRGGHGGRAAAPSNQQNTELRITDAPNSSSRH
ncbi:MAG: hypothetical protein AAF664_15285 [Planctomycetota bacterium]